MENEYGFEFFFKIHLRHDALDDALKTIVFSTDDDNHTRSLELGIASGNTRSIFSGMGIDLVTEILPVSDIVSRLMAGDAGRVGDEKSHGVPKLNQLSSSGDFMV